MSAGGGQGGVRWSLASLPAGRGTWTFLVRYDAGVTREPPVFCRAREPTFLGWTWGQPIALATMAYRVQTVNLGSWEARSDCRVSTVFGVPTGDFMRPTQSLLFAILPLLSSAAVGCGDKDDDTGSEVKTQDGNACIVVDEGAACPEPGEVNPSDMMGSCGSEVVQVTGAGTYNDNINMNWGAEDTGEQWPGCCYPVKETEPTCVYGRPLLVDGAARLAEVVSQPDWAAALVADLGKVPSGVRDELLRRWTRAALDEHASVAAFSKVALDLMRFGAPPELLARTHRAAVEEVRHAELGFAIASAVAGQPVGPGAYRLDAVPLAASLSEVAVAAAREGCIGEALASLLAREAARRVVDPTMREVLTIIAEDEEQHALLAWSTVRWAIEAGGSDVRRAVAEVFAEAAHSGIAVPEAPEADLSRWGLLSRADAESLGRACLAEVVLPAAAVLLKRGSTELQVAELHERR